MIGSSGVKRRVGAERDHESSVLVRAYWRRFYGIQFLDELAPSLRVPLGSKRLFEIGVIGENVPGSLTLEVGACAKAWLANSAINKNAAILSVSLILLARSPRPPLRRRA